MSNQYQIDIQVFIKLVSKFSGISVSKLKNFLKSNDTTTVFEHPTAIGITEQQLKKIEQLKELSSLYKNLEEQKMVYCLNSSKAAGEYFTNYYRGIKDRERFTCAFINAANNIIATEIMNIGTVNETPVYPREIVKKALMHDAVSIIVAHNHPGESLKPSTDDIKLTDILYQVTKSMNINLLDHIIVGGQRYYSFKEEDMLSGARMSAMAAAQEDDYELEI